MSEVVKVLSVKLINDIPDRHCNRLLVEKTPDGYHLHFRNLKLLLTNEEFRFWKEAFRISKIEMIKNNYLEGDII